jgi:phosphatidylglycerophosphate synthase
MFSRWARRWLSRLFHPIICVLIRVGITPNELTVTGLVLSVICGWFIGMGRLGIAAGFLALSGLLDALDGELARQREHAEPAKPPNRLGPFIDSVADHYGDFAVYFSLAWWAIHKSSDLLVYIVFATMFGSLVGSHIRSRAGMVGVDTKNVGIFTRAERYLVLIFALLSGWVTPALGLLAFANNISALQRLIYVLKN